MKDGLRLLGIVVLTLGSIWLGVLGTVELFDRFGQKEQQTVSERTEFEALNGEKLLIPTEKKGWTFHTFWPLDHDPFTVWENKSQPANPKVRPQPLFWKWATHRNPPQPSHWYERTVDGGYVWQEWEPSEENPLSFQDRKRPRHP